MVMVMSIVDALYLSPVAFSLGFLLEPPFDKYVLPVLKRLGKEI